LNYDYTSTGATAMTYVIPPCTVHCFMLTVVWHHSLTHSLNPNQQCAHWLWQIFVLCSKIVMMSRIQTAVSLYGDLYARSWK